MKRLLTLTLGLALFVAVPSITLANGSGNGITGSPHDFSTETWNHRLEICRVCHVPHDHDRNDTLFANGLLWDHALSSETYQMYAEEHPVTIDGAFDAEPTGSSKLCLGCHDGTVGIDQFDNKTAGPGTVFIGDFDAGFQVPGASIPDIGTDKNLTGTHPISITYDEVADPGLAPTSNAMGSGGQTIADVLEGGKVQCSSCHDVHDSVGEAVSGTHLLREANTVSAGGVASGLCLTCHLK